MKTFITLTISLASIFALLISFTKCVNAQEKLILVYTDFGRDVDDALAISCLAKYQNNQQSILVCSGNNPSIRTNSLKLFCKLLNYMCTIIQGKKLISEKDSIPYEVSLYKTLDSLNNISTESNISAKSKVSTGDNSAKSSIIKILSQEKRKIIVLILGPATEFANHLDRIPKIKDHIEAIYIQGQANIINQTNLSPSTESYNLRLDMEAANKIFELQSKIPFILIGKYAAYEAKIDKEDLYSIKNSPAAQYTLKAAQLGLENFAKKEPELFLKIFGTMSPSTISNPYDALAVLSMSNPELFNFTTVGIHKLCGNNKNDDKNIPNPEIIKSMIIKALNKQ